MHACMHACMHIIIHVYICIYLYIYISFYISLSLSVSACTVMYRSPPHPANATAMVLSKALYQMASARIVCREELMDFAKQADRDVLHAWKTAPLR